MGKRKGYYVNAAGVEHYTVSLDRAKRLLQAIQSVGVPSDGIFDQDGERVDL